MAILVQIMPIFAIFQELETKTFSHFFKRGQKNCNGSEEKKSNVVGTLLKKKTLTYQKMWIRTIDLIPLKKAFDIWLKIPVIH